MWQKDKGKYHLLLNFSDGVMEGGFLQTACEDMLQVRRRNQAMFHQLDSVCEVCNGVWHICYTSVDDAKQTLKNTSNLTVLRRATDIAKQATLIKAIEVRIRKVEKDAEKERKLRLIQKA